MGCGVVARGPQVPLYANEFNPPCTELVPINCSYPELYPPSGFTTTDDGIIFDDREFIKQCQIIHIQEVSIYSGVYIVGIDILYFLDGALRLIKHHGTSTGKKFSIPIQVTDSLTFCEVSYNENQLRSLKLITLEGRVIEVISQAGVGTNVKQFDFKNQRRAIVAFKGKFNQHIEGLSLYTWRLCGKK